MDSTSVRYLFPPAFWLPLSAHVFQELRHNKTPAETLMRLQELLALNQSGQFPVDAEGQTPLPKNLHNCIRGAGQPKSLLQGRPARMHPKAPIVRRMPANLWSLARNNEVIFGRKID
jgi:hypothetical protein